jgi:hypothetical protein
MDDLVEREVANHNMIIFIGETIHKLYPLRNWMVSISDCGTMATVLCPEISTAYGYNIRLDNHKLIVEDKAKHAAGEILERFNMSRDPTIDDSHKVLVNHKGEALGAEQGYQ